MLAHRERLSLKSGTNVLTSLLSTAADRCSELQPPPKMAGKTDDKMMWVENLCLLIDRSGQRAARQGRLATSVLMITV